MTEQIDDLADQVAAAWPAPTADMVDRLAVMLPPPELVAAPPCDAAA